MINDDIVIVEHRYKLKLTKIARFDDLYAPDYTKLFPAHIAII
jgi:hypothetical protein